MAAVVSDWTPASPIEYRPCGCLLTTLGFLPATMKPHEQDFILF